MRTRSCVIFCIVSSSLNLAVAAEVRHEKSSVISMETDRQAASPKCPTAVTAKNSNAANIEKLLSDLDPTSKAAAEAVPVLLAALREPTTEASLKERSAKMLARIGEPALEAIPILIEILERPQPMPDTDSPVADSMAATEVRYWAMKSLGLFGTAADSAVPAVRIFLTSSETSPQIRLLAADTLGQIRSPAAAGVLTEELMKPRREDGNDAVIIRQTIIDSLAASGPLAVGAVPGLSRATEDPNVDIRRKACEALGALGPRAEGAIAALLERLILDDDDAVKDAAANALGQLGTPAVKPLVNLLERGEPELQWRAARALGQIGRAAKLSVPLLKQSFGNSSAEVRIEAIDAVWKITRDAVMVAAPLVKELSADNRQVRRRAAQFLIEQDQLPDDVSANLVRLSESGSENAARAAAYVIRERARKIDQ